MLFGLNVRVWATAISASADKTRKIFFRYAKELDGNFNKESQPVRIVIAWKYSSDNGQPTADDHKRMNRLEDALELVLHDAGIATLALVSTGECLREWIYYAASEPEFMARLNYAFAEIPEFPIEIHTALDPTWNTYEEFTAGVQGAES